MWSLLKLKPTVFGQIFLQSVPVVEFWKFQNYLKPVGVSRAKWSLSRLKKTSQFQRSTNTKNLYMQVQHRITVYIR